MFIKCKLCHVWAFHSSNHCHCLTCLNMVRLLLLMTKKSSTSRVRGWGVWEPSSNWRHVLKRHQNYICRLQDLDMIPGNSVDANHEIQLKTFPAIQNMPRHVKTLKRTPTVVFSKRSTFRAEGNGAQPVGRWQMPMLTDLGPEMCQLSILGVNKLLAIAIFGNITLMIQNSERSLAKATRKRSIYIYISNCIYIHTYLTCFAILPFTVLRTFYFWSTPCE